MLDLKGRVNKRICARSREEIYKILYELAADVLDGVKAVRVSVLTNSKAAEAQTGSLPLRSP